MVSTLDVATRKIKQTDVRSISDILQVFVPLTYCRQITFQWSLCHAQRRQPQDIATLHDNGSVRCEAFNLHK